MASTPKPSPERGRRVTSCRCHTRLRAQHNYAATSHSGVGEFDVGVGGGVWVAAEDEAHLRKLGLWADDSPVPPWRW